MCAVLLVVVSCGGGADSAFNGTYEIVSWVSDTNPTVSIPDENASQITVAGVGESCGTLVFGSTRFPVCLQCAMTCAVGTFGAVTYGSGEIDVQIWNQDQLGWSFGLFYAEPSFSSPVFTRDVAMALEKR